MKTRMKISDFTLPTEIKSSESLTYKSEKLKKESNVKFYILHSGRNFDVSHAD